MGTKVLLQVAMYDYGVMCFDPRKNFTDQHKLIVLSYMRCAVSENDNPPTAELIVNSGILELLDSILRLNVN